MLLLHTLLKFLPTLLAVQPKARKVNGVTSAASLFRRLKISKGSNLYKIDPAT